MHYHVIVLTEESNPTKETVAAAMKLHQGWSRDEENYGGHWDWYRIGGRWDGAL